MPMKLGLVILVGILALQLAVIIRGAPYLPTLKRQREQAIDLAGLKPGQTIIDLGSGDGAMLLAAASRGLNAIGYEINPLLVLVSLFRTLRYRRQVRVVWGNFWRAKLPAADAVFVFLIPRHMRGIDELMNCQGKPMKLITYAFKIPGKKIATKKGAIFIYNYS